MVNMGIFRGKYKYWQNYYYKEQNKQIQCEEYKVFNSCIIVQWKQKIK